MGEQALVGRGSRTTIGFRSVGIFANRLVTNTDWRAALDGSKPWDRLGPLFGLATRRVGNHHERCEADVNVREPRPT